MSFLSTINYHWLLLLFVGMVVGACAGGVINLASFYLPRYLQFSWAEQARSTLNLPPMQKAWFDGWSEFRRQFRIIAFGNPLIPFLASALGGFSLYWIGLSAHSVLLILLSWVLLLISKIDHLHGYIPDVLTLTMIWLGLMINSSGIFTDLYSSLIGAIGGYTSLWALFWVHHWLSGQEGVGFGDFKLVAMIGAWGGWHVLPLTLVLASVLMVFGMLILRANMSSRHFCVKSHYAFGPYLAVGGWCSIVQGGSIFGVGP